MINKRQLRLLHRYLGVIAAFFIVVLSSTGILINHTEELSLAKYRIHNPLILSLYGIKPTPLKSYSVANQWLSFDSFSLYFNEQLISTCTNLTGILNVNKIIIVSCEDALVLLQEDGNIIETIDANAGLPTPVDEIAYVDNNILLSSNKKIIIFDMDNLLFTESTSTFPPNDNTLFHNQVAPEKISQSILRQSAANSIDAERMLLDIHSGRILGFFGVLLIDASALLLLFMAASGLWIWLRKN